MSGRIHREFRKQANQVARETVAAVAPAIDAALGNEFATRERVANIEAWAKAFTERKFLGRLRWLLFGR